MKKVNNKINKRRLNKVLNIIISLISIPSSIYAIYLLTQYNDFSNYFSERINSCTDESCRLIWVNWFDGISKTISLCLVLGVGLPIVFYGLKFLIKYITTKDN
jgi:Sec-independent protein secretion pathway component TatC